MAGRSIVTVEPARKVVAARAGRHTTAVPVYHDGKRTRGARRQVTIELDIMVTDGVVDERLAAFGQCIEIRGRHVVIDCS